MMVAARDGERREGWDPMAPQFMTLCETIHVKTGTAILMMMMWIATAILGIEFLTFGSYLVSVVPGPSPAVIYAFSVLLLVVTVASLGCMSYGMQTEMPAFLLPIIILLCVELVAACVGTFAVFITQLINSGVLFAFVGTANMVLGEGLLIWFVYTIYGCFKYFHALRLYKATAEQVETGATAPCCTEEKPQPVFTHSIQIPGQISQPPPYPDH